eukprot:6190393-Pleurochrysis_carterae.AAC.2
MEGAERHLLIVPEMEGAEQYLLIRHAAQPSCYASKRIGHRDEVPGEAGDMQQFVAWNDELDYAENGFLRVRKKCSA